MLETRRRQLVVMELSRAITWNWYGSKHLQLIDGLGRSAPGREGHEEDQ